MINTNLPPILHRFQVITSNRGCLTLKPLLGVIPVNITISDVSLKTRFFGLHFTCRMYVCKLPNSVK